MSGIMDGLLSGLLNVASHVTSLSLVPLLLTVLVAPILLFLILWYFSAENSEIRKLPGPRPLLPVIGSAHFFSSDVSNFLQDMMGYARKFPHFYHIRFGSEFMVLNSPEAAGSIFSSTEHINKNQAYDAALPWLATGLLTSADSKWHKRRKMLTPAFHFNILDQFMDVFNEQASMLVNRLHATNADKVDIFPVITKATLDIICEAAMGVQIGAQKGQGTEYMKAVNDMNYVIFMRFMTPWLSNESLYRWSSYYRTQERCLKFLHGFTDSVIKKRRAELAASSTKDNNPASKKRLAFLDLLLASTIDDQPLTDADIREEVDTFMFEGHDTTSSATSWILYNLGRFPDIQARAFAEVQDVLGDDPSTPITRDHLAKLRYLEMVIKESMRLFPPVPMMGRRLASDVTINGYNIPRRCMVTLFIYAIHRDPRHWPDPELFDPERFSSENMRGRHPYAYVPFSAGPRNCIGQKFAMMEEKVLIAQVLRQFEIKALDKYDDLKVTSDIILRSDGPLWLSFTQRYR